MENASQFAAEYNKAVDEVSRATNWLSRWCNAGGALIASGFKKNYEEANEPKMARVSTEILEEIVDGLRKGGVIMGKDQKTGACSAAAAL